MSTSLYHHYSIMICDVSCVSVYNYIVLFALQLPMFVFLLIIIFIPRVEQDLYVLICPLLTSHYPPPHTVVLISTVA